MDPALAIVSVTVPAASPGYLQHMFESSCKNNCIAQLADATAQLSTET
jgi:hypothetical protein